MASWRVPTVLVLVGLSGMAWGCREPLDFDRALTADAERGARLYRTTCANSCHPANAYEPNVRKVKNWRQLAHVVRDHYEREMGDDPDSYSQQDIFDIARYLDKTYYKFRRY